MLIIMLIVLKGNLFISGMAERKRVRLPGRGNRRCGK